MRALRAAPAVLWLYLPLGRSPSTFHLDCSDSSGHDPGGSKTSCFISEEGQEAGGPHCETDRTAAARSAVRTLSGAGQVGCQPVSPTAPAGPVNNPGPALCASGPGTAAGPGDGPLWGLCKPGTDGASWGHLQPGGKGAPCQVPGATPSTPPAPHNLQLQRAWEGCGPKSRGLAWLSGQLQESKAEISISRATAWPSSPITGPLDRFRGRAAPPQGCLGEWQHWPWADLGSQRETPGNGGDPQTLQEQKEKPIPFQRAEFGGWEPHCHVSLCLSWRDAGGGRCHQSRKGLVGELSPQLCFSTTSWLLPHRRKTLKCAS